MDIAVLSHEPATGWNSPWPPLDSPRTLVLAFGPSRLRHEPAPLRELRGAFPRSVLVGCSTAGEILDGGIRDDTLTVAVARFRATELKPATTRIESSANSHAAGRRLGEQLCDPALAGVLVLSEGLHVNGSELVRGITEGLASGVSVTGGLAGDGERFEHTWVAIGGEPEERFASALGFYGGSVRYGHGSVGGWDIFGPERTITRSEGNVLYELDGRPALELYKLYLGELAEGLPATGLLFPLAVRYDHEDRQLVRTILAVDESTQTMTFAGDVPQGCRAQLMQANFDRLIGGAELAAEQASPAHADPVLAVAISCVGRRLVLGDRTEEEVEATLDRLPAGSRQVGFYSYGEISPYTDGTCDLHNQTMTLTTIGEDA